MRVTNPLETAIGLKSEWIPANPWGQWKPTNTSSVFYFAFKLSLSKGWYAKNMKRTAKSITSPIFVSFLYFFYFITRDKEELFHYSFSSIIFPDFFVRSGLRPSTGSKSGDRWAMTCEGVKASATHGLMCERSPSWIELPAVRLSADGVPER